MNEPQYGTGLRLSWDSRNEDHPVAALLDRSAAPVDRKWDIATADRENQGNTPECVGAALTQELAADPTRVAITHPFTRQNIYRKAQTLDEWAGEAYDGTSLNAGMKALRGWGYVTEWRWAASIDDVLQSLSQLGPVILAGPWLTGMFTPDAQGRIPVNGTAGNIGHCYMLGERQQGLGRSVVEQSWGPSWSRFPGPDGGWRGSLYDEDLYKLLQMGTQAAVITGRANPDAPAPPPPPVKHQTGTVAIFSDGSWEVRPVGGPSGGTMSMVGLGRRGLTDLGTSHADKEVLLADRRAV